MPVFTLCSDCRSEHMGGPCGMTFGQRLRTVQVDRTNFDTAEKRNYFDRESANAVFGLGPDDRPEEMMADETQGRGFIDQADLASTPTDVLESYLDGPELDPALDDE